MSKKVKPKKKVNAVRVWAIIVSALVVLALIGLLGGIFIISKLLQDKPTINLSDFDQAESSVIYDSQGEEIANLGTVIRQNVEYEEIPNCVVDAFVAIEDSRYFQHNGFDIPRFTKAIIENIKTMSFGQGGSTFTMQLVKNTYFVNDETGENASRSGASGIKRKVQEIALSFELEDAKSKQDIFESYVNKLNFGGSNNIRGIQKAAQYYFGKDLSQCTLVEGALLAGVINAPNYYNPFYNLEAAQERVTEVLYQMKNHGYITQAEYDLAKSVRVEDLLKDPYAKNSEGNGIPYQAYIDQVVNEVRTITGLDPYTTTMHVYTYMNKGIQEQMDKIQAGDMDDYLVYPDDYFEVASVCIKNTTGEVVGILGGRNYANGGQLLLNHATEQYKQPGSSIKPILDYALAFENLGWATDHVLTDKPMWLDETYSIPVINDSGTYTGDVTLRDALGNSINTCAIQTLQQVLAAKKYEYVVNYAQSLGYNFTLDEFNIQYAMGGSTCEVTPYIHAGAYAAIMNYGSYTPPHTIARIEFTNGKSPITPVYESTQVISEAAAYLTTELMYSNVQNYGGTYSYVRNSDYPVYGKTGTTDYGNSATELGVPSGSIKDGWLVAATSEYTTATWVGYERVVANQPSYITKDYYYNDRPQGKIAHLILDAAYQYGGGTPTRLERPSGITSITHVIGTWPYAAFTEGMDESLRTTGLIKSDSVRLVTLAEPSVEGLSNLEVSLDSTNSSLTIKWPKYPKEEDTQEASDTKDISLKNSAGDVIIAATGKNLFSYTKLYGPIRYMADVTITGSQTTTQHVVSSDENESITLSIRPGDKINVKGYYAYEKGSAKSNEVEKNLSSEVTVTFPANASYEQLQSFANQYSFITLQTVTFDSSHNIGDYVITSSSGGNITPGTQLKISDSTTFTITYYVDKPIQIVETSEGENIVLTAVYDSSSSYTWNYPSIDGIVYESSGNKLTINPSGLQESKSFDVTVTVDGTSNSATYTVNINKG